MSMKLGIFGGSFDPPHLGHLQIAEAAKDQLGLDEVVFVPTHTNPEKQRTKGATPKRRLKMVELLIEDREGLAASDLEITRGGLSYTVDTLQELNPRKGSEVHLILGGDSLAGFYGWKQPEKIVRIARIGCVVRPKFDKDVIFRSLPDEFHQYIDWIEMEPNAISSTGIRSLILQGEPWRHLTIPAVADYIEAHGLYDLKTT